MLAMLIGCGLRRGELLGVHSESLLPCAGAGLFQKRNGKGFGENQGLAEVFTAEGDGRHKGDGENL
jgi:hypothetical protein